MRRSVRFPRVLDTWYCDKIHSVRAFPTMWSPLPNVRLIPDLLRDQFICSCQPRILRSRIDSTWNDHVPHRSARHLSRPTQSASLLGLLQLSAALSMALRFLRRPESFCPHASLLSLPKCGPARCIPRSALALLCVYPISTPESGIARNSLRCLLPAWFKVFRTRSTRTCHSLCLDHISR